MSKKVIVIGSGFGGLAAAIRLQSAGHQVTLLEGRDVPGGRAYVYKQDGFTFDAGPTVITAPACIEELFQIAGEDLADYVELLPVNPFYRLVWDDKTQFDYGSSVAHTLSEIRRLAPEDEKGYLKFLKYSEEVFEQGYTRLAHVPFLRWWKMVQVSPQLVKLGAYRSVYSMVSKFIKNEKLRQAFSFHALLVGGNPFATSSIYTLIHFLERKWGVWFPRGGTGALVQALVKVFERKGGRLKLGTAVDEITVVADRATGVRLKDGSWISADAVVSNADVVHTYQHLLRSDAGSLAKGKAKSQKPHSMSLFLIYFGTKKTYPQLAHHTVLFGPRYKGLLKEIFGEGHLPEDFSLYLHAPTRTDASLAPPGHEAFYVLSPVAHLGHSQVDWQTEGPLYANKILKSLEDHLIPGLSENLVTQKIFTPLDFKSELNAHWGSAFSLEPRLTQSAYFRTHNQDSRIQNLFFVGAGTHPGAGVPGVIQSAKATASVALDYLREPVPRPLVDLTVESV